MFYQTTMNHYSIKLLVLFCKEFNIINKTTPNNNGIMLFFWDLYLTNKKPAKNNGYKTNTVILSFLVDSAHETNAVKAVYPNVMIRYLLLQQ